MVAKFQKTIGLNDGEVVVVASYVHPYASTVMLEEVLFNQVDVQSILNPEDYDYITQRLYEWALQNVEEVYLEAAEAEWERRRDDELLGV